MNQVSFQIQNKINFIDDFIFFIKNTFPTLISLDYNFNLVTCRFPQENVIDVDLLISTCLSYSNPDTFLTLTKVINININSTPINSLVYKNVGSFILNNETSLLNRIDLLISGYGTPSNYNIKIYDLSSNLILGESYISNTGIITIDNLQNIPIEPSIIEFQLKTDNTSFFININSVLCYYYN